MGRIRRASEEFLEVNGVGAAKLNNSKKIFKGNKRFRKRKRLIMKKIICFDVDGTLTVHKSSWLELTRTLGLPQDMIADVYCKTENGTMTFAKGLEIVKDIYLASENTNRSYIANLFDNMPLRIDARQLIDHLRARGYLIYLVSGAIDMYVESIANQLKPDGYMALWSFGFDKQGALCDIGYKGTVNQKIMKANYVNELSKIHGVPVKQIAFAGDSENDLEAFRLTGRGIAVEPYSEALRPVAWKTVKSLAEVCEILSR